MAGTRQGLAASGGEPAPRGSRQCTPRPSPSRYTRPAAVGPSCYAAFLRSSPSRVPDAVERCASSPSSQSPRRWTASSISYAAPQLQGAVPVPRPREPGRYSNPLPSQVGLAVLEVLERDGLAARTAELGAYLRSGLQSLQEQHECIGDIRGRGLLIGVELVSDRETRAPAHDLGSRVSKRCLELGLNMNILRLPGMGSVFRIAPPLTVTRDETDSALSIFDQALRECSSTRSNV